jgi:glyoxylase I family protein
VARLHHASICTTDVERSLRFWRDGLGLAVLMDATFPGDWPILFGARSSSLRAVFLGDPAAPDDGIVELVEFGETTDDRRETLPEPATGFLLLSLYADIDAVLPTLAALEVGGEPRTTEVARGVRLAVVRDPNGVLVELMDRKAQQNLAKLTGIDGP